MAGKKIKIERDFNCNNTLVRLLVQTSESLRKDFTTVANGASYGAIKRVRRHIADLRIILREMSVANQDARGKVIEARWGGEIPASYTRQARKKRSETEPLIL